MGARSDENNTWKEWSLYVKEALKDFKTQIKELRKELTDLKIEMAVLKTKIAIYGAIGAILGSALFNITLYFIKKSLIVGTPTP